MNRPIEAQVSAGAADCDKGTSDRRREPFVEEPRTLIAALRIECLTARFALLLLFPRELRRRYALPTVLRNQPRDIICAALPISRRGSALRRYVCCNSPARETASRAATSRSWRGRTDSTWSVRWDPAMGLNPGNRASYL